MRLNFSTVKTLFCTELRMVMRDRRMVVTSILLPLLVTPLIFLGSTLGIKRHEKKLQEMVYPYAVSGPQADTGRRLLSVTRERLDASAKTNKTVFQYWEVRCSDPVAALNKEDIQFFIECVSAADVAADKTTNAVKKTVSRGEKRNDEELEEDAETPVPGAPVVRIVFRGDRHESISGMSKMRQALAETRRLERGALLNSQGFPVPISKLAVVTESDLASQTQVAGLALGKSLTVLLLLFIFSSGAVVATDSLAGEKERGTLETLLTTSAGRLEILTAKQLVIVAVALVITTIQMLNLLAYVHLKLIPLPANWVGAITPWTLAVLFVLYIPLAALSANVLLLVSGYARNYKEAQMWFLPVLLVGLAPALVPLLPGVPLRSAAVLVPVANLALAAKEILIGSFDWPMIALAWLVTAAAAVWTAKLGVRSLVQEKLITAAETDAVDLAGGPALFERRVLLWFGVLWAVLLMASNYTQNADIRVQLGINLIVLFFGSCCLMIWIYRLKPKQALALRAPRPAVWLGLVLAIPGGMLAALGLARLANHLVPAPAKVVERFGEAIVPESVPFIQIVLFMTVLPGIFEEITFRGLLLYGLRRRLPPIWLALVVGATFGIFHVALFRLVPTAALGVMFAAVVLLTGSIFPAIVWHACSNGLGLLAYRFGFPENEMEPICYFAGTGLLAVAFWIFWRNRTPYPDLRGSRGGK